MQAAEMYVEQAIRLVVWRHAGQLVKALELTVDGQPLPKPYLGAPISDEAAAFLAVGDGPAPEGPVSLVIRDDAGSPVFESDEVPARPLTEAQEGLGGADVCNRLLARILRHAPKKLPGWTDGLTDAVAVLRPVRQTPSNADDGKGAAAVLASTAASGLRGAIDFVDGRRVAGWALDLSAPEKTLTLQFEVDGIAAGVAVAHEPREDLDPTGAGFPHGFHVLLRKEAMTSPWRELRRLRVRDLSSGRLVIDGHPFRFRPGQDERDITSFARRIDRLEQTLLELREQVPQLRCRAAYSLDDYDLWFRHVHEPVLLSGPAGDTAPGEPSGLTAIGVIVPLTAQCTLAQFERILDSLAGQAGDGHQYLVINGSQDDDAHKQLAGSYVERVPRLTWIDLREPTGTAFLQAVLRYTDAGHLFFLEPQEALGRGALEWLARAFAGSTSKVLYADSDHIGEQGLHQDPRLRPDFNPDLLLSTHYVGAFGIERTLLEQLAGEIKAVAHGVWQYELLLRAAERIAPNEWLHVAGVLTHSLISHHHGQDESGLEGALSVLRDHLGRMDMPAAADIDDALYQNNPAIPRSPSSFAARVRWQIPDPAPKVSIIIPTRDAPDLLRTCVESIQTRTLYTEREIILVDHSSTDPEARRYLDGLADLPDVHVIRYRGEFNWSAMNNLAASRALGAVLCFLNNDTQVLSRDWLTEMVGHALRPGIGAVGAKLLLRDGTLQHGGVILGANGIAEHAFTGLPADQPGYMMRAGLTQNLSAVTGACLVCRREVFEAVGGFEMVNLGVAFNDVDFCLRLAAAGYRIVWTPHARLYHEGSRTRGRDRAAEQRARLDREMAYLRDRWGKRLQRDPHYPPAFERFAEPYAALGTLGDLPLAGH